MKHTNHEARQARVRRGLDGVVAAYIRDISVRNGELSGHASSSAGRDRHHGHLGMYEVATSSPGGRA